MAGHILKKSKAILGFIVGVILIVFIWLEYISVGVVANGEHLQISQPEKAEPALLGHWLRTEKDAYLPAQLRIEKQPAFYQGKQTPLIINLEKARSTLNRSSDSINILYIWNDGDQLKVISITSFNKKTKQAAIIVIPLYTVINNGDSVNLKTDYSTIQDLYKEKGRTGVRDFLETKMDIRLPNFVHVNQGALKKISDIVGVLSVNNGQTTMLEAFEQTAAGLRTDDRDVVRTVASQVLKPRIVLEVPNLLNIFTQDIKTNFTVAEMIKLFYFSRQMDLRNMRKTSLPGFEYLSSTKYLFVSSQVWQNIVYEITRL